MVILAAIASLFVTFGAQPQAKLPRDFSIHFEFGLCWRDVVDTQSDRYVRDLATWQGGNRTVPLQLSAAQRRQLLAWVDESVFVDLPKELDASVVKDGVGTLRHPSEKFLIDIQRSGARHVVEFDDNGDSKAANVVRVRRLAERLKKFFTALPQVKVLPKKAVGCL